MANNTETDGNTPNWIDDRLAALDAPDDFHPDAAAGRRHNPALVLHFPERAPVQDVPLRNGDKGIFVGVPDGSDGGICFFWKTDDRIFIVSADKLSLERAVALADSVK